MKVLVIVAKRYNGHEFWVSLGTLASNNISFEVISTETTIRDEITLKPHKIATTIDDFEPDKGQYDGLMVISGNMKDTEGYWKHQKVLSLVKAFDIAGKPVAAICCSVPTIRQIAHGKKVSFFPLIRSRELLEQAGAIPQTITITVDGNLITAEHQMATQVWAEGFVDLLNGKDPDIRLQDSGYTPQGRERKPMPELERLKSKRTS